jgi:hypothetical protein
VDSAKPLKRARKLPMKTKAKQKLGFRGQGKAQGFAERSQKGSRRTEIHRGNNLTDWSA